MSSDKEYDLGVLDEDNFSRTGALTIVSPANSGLMCLHQAGGYRTEALNTRAHTNAHSYTSVSSNSTDDDEDYLKQQPYRQARYM